MVIISQAALPQRKPESMTNTINQSAFEACLMDIVLVSLVVGIWYTLPPTIVRMAENLETLGFRYSDYK